MAARIGLHALGIGPGARREVVDAVACAAERHGFATLWVGEHVVMVDESSSRYPYDATGEIPVPPGEDWLDPLVCLSFAAAATQTIRIATGILLLPEHNPVVVAKQAATLDVMSNGRLVLGVGVGWSKEEFAALGVPFEQRGARTDEYVSALRTIWAHDVASFSGRFAAFDSIRVYPKPMRDRRVPVVFGGNSDAALRRVANHGDGWYGFNLADVEAVRDHLTRLRDYCAEARREFDELDIAVSVSGCEPRDLPELSAIGVDELILVEPPPAEAAEASDWVARLGERWRTT